MGKTASTALLGNPRSYRFLTLCFAGAMALPLASPARAAEVPDLPAPQQLDAKLFPQPKGLDHAVAFWTDIFAKYDGHHVVVHDEWDLDRVYTVLDFSELDANPALSDVAKERRRKDVVRVEQEKLKNHLLKLAAGQPLDDKADAERFTQMFGANAPRDAYKLAIERLRFQTGLKEQFERALTRSGRYMPFLEEVFTRRGLPVELTRLPFVESMFQENARSKVAAGGIWQIMPSTGRRFLRVAGDVDERYDPILAAEAAASVLRENFGLLGTWPLAITAYNHGAGGLRKAVSTLGTQDMGVICREHKGRLFGFASRNFYAEFLAAATLYTNRQIHFPEVTPEPAWRYDVFATEHYIPVQELATRAQVPVGDLALLNPAVDSDVWAGRMLMPAGYRLRVPAGQADAFRTAYAALPDQLKLQRQTGTQYRVRGGDTLSTIAHRFGTTVNALQHANRFGKKTTLRVGQTIDIPGSLNRVAARPPATSTVVASATPAPTLPTAAPPAAITVASSAAPSVTVKVADAGPADPVAKDTTPAAAEPQSKSAGFHVVKKGDTLFSIARHYGVSIRTLMTANGLKTSHRIFPGQRLAIGR